MVRRSFLILLLLLQACGTARLRALAGPTDEVDQERRAITRRLAGVTLTVEVEAWRHRPKRLVEDYLPIRVQIVNQSRDAVTLVRSEAGLLIDQAPTLRSFHPEEVIGLLVGGLRLPPIIPTVGFEATGPEPTIFGLELGLQINPERDLRDIRRMAFPPDPIPPGERVEGFIYFPKPPRNARHLTLLLTLDFPSGQHHLPFSF